VQHIAGMPAFIIYDDKSYGYGAVGFVLSGDNS
jgi:hypothetical protein